MLGVGEGIVWFGYRYTVIWIWRNGIGEKLDLFRKKGLCISLDSDNEHWAVLVAAC